MRFPAILLPFLALPSLFAASPVYRITHKFTLAGEGRWDYVVPDPPRHRLFIGRENRVMVVNERNGKLLGAVLGIDGAHGVALVRHTGHGFATSGNDGSRMVTNGFYPGGLPVPPKCRGAQSTASF